LSDYLARNVASWTRRNAEYTGPNVERAWAREEITWGMFHVPEAELRILGDVAGLDVVELGCGTAYFSAYLARLGARVVGVDPTPAQLESARHAMAVTGIEFPLVEAPAESVPLDDESFDLALSEHGAVTWADPQRWIPEAARLLRPGGRLVFLHTTPLEHLCYADDEEQVVTALQRSYFTLGREDWGEDGVGFQLTHGGWIDVLRSAGFDVERLVELQAPEDATTHRYYSDVSAQWARQWPAEEIWVARKR